MSATANQLHLSLSFNQLFELVKQLPAEQKRKLMKVLQKESIDNVIPEEHKAMVRERIKNSKASELLDWEDVKDDFDGI